MYPGVCHVIKFHKAERLAIYGRFDKYLTVYKSPKNQWKIIYSLYSYNVKFVKSIKSILN